MAAILGVKMIWLGLPLASTPNMGTPVLVTVTPEAVTFPLKFRTMDKTGLVTVDRSAGSLLTRVTGEPWANSPAVEAENSRAETKTSVAIRSITHSPSQCVDRNRNTPNRVANLCSWAKINEVKLLPVLVGTEKGKPTGDDFAPDLGSFIKATVGAMRGGDAQRLQDYAQLLAFQVGADMNDAGVTGAAQSTAAQKRVIDGATALRKAEEESLKDSGVDATPIMANASFDFELIRSKSMAGATLTGEAYGQARAALKQYISAFVGSSDVDLVGVTWLPGSVGAGSVDKLPDLLRDLKEDAAGKQLIITTGCSSGFKTEDEQKQFYTVAFSNLADFRVRDGNESPFMGVFYREAVSSADAGLEPPTADLPAAMASWDWSAKSEELAKMLAGETASPELAWWLKKTEGNLGLLAMTTDSAGGVSFTARPAQQALLQIAGAVGVGTASSVTVATEDIQLSPASPGVGQPVNCGITVHNQSPDAEATGLVVALVDSGGYVLGSET